MASARAVCNWRLLQRLLFYAAACGSDVDVGRTQVSARADTRVGPYCVAPTRYFSPVGAGTPPSGSSVTASATGLGMSDGVASTIGRPLSSGLRSPALMGAFGVTNQS